MSVVLTSASGILALLDEPGDDVSTLKLKSHALKNLVKVVDQFWPELAPALPTIETLSEDDSFGDRELASSVASKVHYHLEALDDSVKFALGAGDLFDVAEKSEYVETLIAKCIDKYIQSRNEMFQGDEKHQATDLDVRLESIVDRMFERCYDDGEYKQALGIALESRNIAKVEESIKQSSDIREMLAYCFKLCQSVVQHRGFRMIVLRQLVDIYNDLETKDFINICQCLFFLDDAKAIAETLDDLIREGEEQAVTAYQIAFDLCENQNQPFLLRVLDDLQIRATDPKESKPQKDDAKDQQSDETAMDTSDGSDPLSQQGSDEHIDVQHRAFYLKSILSGERSIDLHLQFLYSHNHTDSYILNHIMDKLEVRNSITHNATVMAHAIIQCGTTADTFLRQNLDWLSRAVNWAKFSASASFGVVHKGHIRESMKLLGSYLPKQGQQGSPYQEGGALYALGLIHACHGDEKINYVMEALGNSSHNEIIQHGACLGLGLTAMSTARSDVYNVLKDTLNQDSAVAGEAAALSMGLVLVGSARPQPIEEMIAYAHDTKHEKIVRGLGIGVALVMYGREEEADGLIEQLLLDQDPILRYGGCFAIALAYVATGNNRMIKRLLHIAVSDVSDDVRRAAIIAIGFVLCNDPTQVPKIVKLLSQSYNPHARYGAAFAIGISCVGSGMKSAIELLDPLMKDRVDYVRQAAYMSMAMVLIQHNEAQSPKIKDVLEIYTKAIDNKHVDHMTKMGAIIASGIINCGGRNCTISLVSEAGHKRMASIVGVVVFLQYWYWYPLTHFLSLAITPTAVIGLNKDLQMPQYFRFKSNADPKLYAYPANIKTRAVEKRKKMEFAELSITAKAKARKAKKEKEKREEEKDDMEIDTPKPEDESEKMEVDEPGEPESAEKGEADAKMAVSESDDKSEKGPENEEAKFALELAEKAKDQKYAILANPCRVTPHQQAVIEITSNQRYVPVKRKLAGIVMLRDTRPDEEQNLIMQEHIKGVDVDDEPSPPEPFEFLR